jgi:hypothetical protein
MSQVGIYSNQGFWSSSENSPGMMDGPVMGDFSSGGTSSSGMLSKLGE